MQLASSGATFVECFCLQNLTFISWAAVNGLVKTVIFSWVMGSVSLRRRGLTFLSETFPNNYTIPESSDTETLRPGENYNCIRTHEVGMWIFNQQSKQDLSVSHGHKIDSVHFAVTLAGSICDGSPLIKVLSKSPHLWLCTMALAFNFFP